MGWYPGGPGAWFSPPDPEEPGRTPYQKSDGPECAVGDGQGRVAGEAVTGGEETLPPDLWVVRRPQVFLVHCGWCRLASQCQYRRATVGARV